MSTVKKTKQTPDNYAPNEKPEIISLAEKLSSTNQYQVYKTIEYRMDNVEMPDTLKMAGVTSENNPNFQNIDKYHKEFKPLMLDKHAPYTEIGISGNMTNPNGDYIFGCQVNSLEDLPKGLFGFDTGIKKFASITFRAHTAYELVGGNEGPGDGMQTASEYIKEVWLPLNKELVYPVNLDYMYFDIKTEDKDYCLFMIEVYKVELEDEPEMCFYIPLKA